jgi:hypothetical protein
LLGFPGRINIGNLPGRKVAVLWQLQFRRKQRDRSPFAGLRLLATATVARFFEAARRGPDASTPALAAISFSRHFHFFYLFRDFFETFFMSVG